MTAPSPSWVPLYWALTTPREVALLVVTAFIGMLLAIQPGDAVERLLHIGERGDEGGAVGLGVFAVVDLALILTAGAIRRTQA